MKIAILLQITAFQIFIGCSLAQNVFQDYYKVDPEKADETKITVEYKPNPNFKVCSCDKN